MSTIVKRLNLSPYQNPEYSFWEEKMVNELSLSYLSANDKLPSDSKKRLILISNAHTDWKETPSQILKQTDLIIHPNSGYDNFSASFLRQNAIPVVAGNTIRSHAVANYILSCLLGHFNQLPERHSWDPNRVWRRELLSEKKVMLLGYGHIGRILEKSLTPLVKELVIHDPYKNKNIDLVKEASDSNIIIPVTSYNKSSHHIINHELLGLFPNDFLLINAARGELVDNNALFSHLKAKKNAFAYLDVFENEPFNFRDVDHLSNIKLSSHIAGCFTNLDHQLINTIKVILKDHLDLSSEQFETKYQSVLLHKRIIDNQLI